MTIFNLGSINTDHFYRLPHLPAPGETLAALGYARGLGGKGANQSVAVARAGGKVCHVGAIGPEGNWMSDRMEALGVDCTHVARIETVSGHAIINTDPSGENLIVIHPGANREIPPDAMITALGDASQGDYLILQNESSLQVEAARFARERGLFVVYSAAPFDAAATQQVLPYVSLLMLNEIEAAQLCAALNCSVDALPVPYVCVTMGGKGAVWRDLKAETSAEVPAYSVEVADTTGAGDTFTGYLITGLSEGMEPIDAMRLASAAAALKVTRSGTADAIPDRDEVAAFMLK